VKLVLASAAPTRKGSPFFLNLNLPAVARWDLKIEIKELKLHLQGWRELSTLQIVPGGGTRAGINRRQEQSTFISIHEKRTASEREP